MKVLGQILAGEEKRLKKSGDSIRESSSALQRLVEKPSLARVGKAKLSSANHTSQQLAALRVRDENENLRVSGPKRLLTKWPPDSLTDRLPRPDKSFDQMVSEIQSDAILFWASHDAPSKESLEKLLA